MIRIFKTSIPSLPGETEEVPRREPEVSSQEPRRVALPLPGQEVSRASPQYQRMLEKLNNDVELHKLHVKHYHMSSAQFRRRTGMLGLPGEIYDYDKYDRIVKGCRVCSTSVPMPPRARIAGLRASSFGDLIFVDHEEIKFGNKAYLALVIIDGALPVWKRQRLWELFVNGLRRTTVFQRELSEIKHFSPINSWLITSSMGLLLILVDLALLGQTVPRPQFGCSNEHGRSWQRPWLTRAMLRRLLFVRQ